MKTLLSLAFILIITGSSCAQFNLKGLKKETDRLGNEAGKVLNNTKPLTEGEIIAGLKEALTVGSNNSASLASKLDGYYKNPKLFIPFPPEALKVEKTLRDIGLGKKVDEFIQTLNRGAEEAAKSAAPIFVDAVKKMTIKDGLGILNGANDAATSYLKSNTSTQLTTKFKPVINEALQKVSATKYWADLMNTYNKIPGVSKMNPDLAGYTTEKAIAGLFILVSNEELKIRQDPTARVTDILKKVFGKK